MDVDQLLTQTTASAAIVYALQWLKAWPAFRWVRVDTGTINRVLSVVLAAGVAWGISLTGNAEAGWTVQIPPLAVLLSGMAAWAKQFVLQQVIYDAVVKKAPPAPAPATTGGQ